MSKAIPLLNQGKIISPSVNSVDSKRYPHPNASTFSRGRFHAEVSIGQPHALLNSQEAQALLPFGLARNMALDPEGPAVVADLHADAILKLPHVEPAL